MKDIRCILGFHDWKIVQRIKSLDWEEQLLPDFEEVKRCSRCPAEKREWRNWLDVEPGEYTFIRSISVPFKMRVDSFGSGREQYLLEEPITLEAGSYWIGADAKRAVFVKVETEVTRELIGTRPLR